ncbi:MAG: MFS transporter [Desulfobacterales bacterium]|nr:MFS transporter [Desulfobacterales bacterium]
MTTPEARTAPPLRVAWTVWGLGASFYLMAFFQRVAPAVMTDALMREFQIGAAALGNLSALYFYSYVAMQIPTGIIADGWGPRRLLSMGALVAASGILIFALSPGFALVGLGRFLIGGSVAVAFVGCLQLANNWFPPRLYGLVAGMALFVGIVGAVCAGPPLRLCVNAFGWRPTILVSGLVTVAIALAIWVLVRDHPHEKGYAGPAAPTAKAPPVGRMSVLHGIRAVLHYPNTMLLFLIPGGVVGPVLAFSGLWGVPFLVTHYELDPTQASALSTTLLVAWAIGGPILGWLSDRTGRRKPLYIGGCAVSLACWLLMVFVPDLPLAVLLGVLIVAGLSAGCMIISFAFAKESVPANLSGTVTGVTNMGVMMGPMVLQPAIGWMLDHRWQGALEHGIRVYSLGAYQAGFGLMIAWAGLSVVLLLFTRETFCQPLGE